jgi:hypothetical protein
VFRQFSFARPRILIPDGSYVDFEPRSASSLPCHAAVLVTVHTEILQID